MPLLFIYFFDAAYIRVNGKDGVCNDAMVWRLTR